MKPGDELTHFSAAGRARMVDVSGKPDSVREAVASGVIRMRAATLARIRAGSIGKGNVLAVADVAAVMAAKRTPETIPMCHAVPLAGVEVDFEDIEEDPSGARCGEEASGAGLRATVGVRCVGSTGVEMEALCAVSAALLTIYDMCKSIDRGMLIERVQLEEKRGGRSGEWRRRDPGAAA